MSIILDLIIVLLLAVNIFVGYKKGFIRSLFHTFSVILSLLCAYLFSPSVANYLNSSFVSGSVRGKVSSSLSSLIDTSDPSQGIQKLFTDMPEAFKKTLAAFRVDVDALAEKFSDAIANGSESLFDDVVNYIADPLSKGISSVIAFLLVFVVAFVVLFIVTIVLNAVCNLPKLKKLNAVLGLAAGAVSGLLLTWVISSLFVVLVSVLSKLGVVSESVIDNTLLVKLLASMKWIPTLW